MHCLPFKWPCLLLFSFQDGQWQKQYQKDTQISYITVTWCAAGTLWQVSTLEQSSSHMAITTTFQYLLTTQSTTQPQCRRTTLRTTPQTTRLQWLLGSKISCTHSTWNCKICLVKGFDLVWKRFSLSPFGFLVAFLWFSAGCGMMIRGQCMPLLCFRLIIRAATAARMWRLQLAARTRCQWVLVVAMSLSCQFPVRMMWPFQWEVATISSFRSAVAIKLKFLLEVAM